MSAPQTPMGQPAPPPPMYAYGRPPRPRRHYPIETKPFFLTSEFAGIVLAIIALGITAAADNSVDSRFFWIITSVLLSAYVLSRGIAKSGTRSMAIDPRDNLDITNLSGQGDGAHSQVHAGTAA